MYLIKGVSGSSIQREGLDRALKQIKNGDVLVVWKLDRLGRSLHHLIELIETLRGKGVGFQSLSDGISTTTAEGQLVFHIMGALAEFERSLIIERTKAGLEAANRRGKYPGRPKRLNPQQIKHAKKLWERREENDWQSWPHCLKKNAPPFGERFKKDDFFSMFSANTSSERPRSLHTRQCDTETFDTVAFLKPSTPRTTIC